MPETYITPRANQLDVLEQIAANTKIASDMLTDPVPTPAQGLTDAQLRATAIPTTDSLGGTRAFNWANNVREVYGTTSTAAIALPTLGASREMRVHTSSNAFIRFGGSDVSPATVGQGQMKSPSELPDVIRVPVGQTHCRVIGETASGSISLTAVV